MHAMVLEKPGEALVAADWPQPTPAAEQALIRVLACAVCRTDLHLVDGELPDPKLPLVPGHEIVGRVEQLGEAVTDLEVGQRVGVPWLGHTCGRCRYCRRGQENLCDAAGFTGYTLDGGYAQFCAADARFCFPLPARYDAVHAAPLLCAGLIGYRSLRLCGDGVEALGLYGFGAAAHILTQLAVERGIRVYAFTRPGDAEAQAFAQRLGVEWAGGSDEAPPERLDAAIIFAPVGALVPAALKAVAKGGTVVCGGIHMSDIPSFAYADLWQERHIRSVANLTRADGRAFLQAADEHPISTHIERFPLGQANEALNRLREGRLNGAAVLTP